MIASFSRTKYLSKQPLANVISIERMYRVEIEVVRIYAKVGEEDVLNDKEIYIYVQSAVKDDSNLCY